LTSQYGFEVKLNGKKISRAGLDKDDYVITCHVTALKFQDRENIDLKVSGMNSTTQTYLKWTEFVPLKKGDKISIKVITEDFDVPSVTGTSKPGKELENKIKHYYKLKEELKDYLKE